MSQDEVVTVRQLLGPITPAEKVLNWLYRTFIWSFQRAWMQIKWAYERVRYGYDRRAHWDLHIYLAKIAGPVCRNMCKHSTGHPVELTQDQWIIILDKIAYAMDMIAKEDVVGNLELDPLEHTMVEEGLDLFRKWYWHLWD